MPTYDKNKTFTLSKTKFKKVILCLLYCDFFVRGYHKTKRECAHKNTQIIQTRTLNDEHGLNAISLHSVGFELFKKVLPHLCFIIAFICDLFVSRDDPLMS